MPSGCAAPTSIFLITVIVLVSNIETGLLLENPWPDFGSTATPLPPVSGISPAGSSVSRLNAVIRPWTPPTAAAVSRASLAAGPGGAEHFVGRVGRGLLGQPCRGQKSNCRGADQAGPSHIKPPGRRR